MMMRKFGRWPEVIVDGDVDATFVFIPAHLEYILQELYKNAFRATAEFHRNDAALPPVRMTVCVNDSYITLRISDQGGGFPVSLTSKLWEYSYTSIVPDEEDNASMFSVMTSDAPRMGVLAGLGFGLPMSRVYTEYLGGSLDIVGMHGYGSDVFLRVNRLDAHADNLFVC
jgi:signal transduction histidine kinase